MYTNLLSTLPIGEIHWYDEISSTNDAAFEAAEAGAPDMSVFAAGKQSAGRGRMRRTWVMTPGSSIAVSLLLRLSQAEMSSISLFSPLAGVAVCETLRESYEIPAQVKWPNDVLLNRKKICGVLCETRWQGEALLGPVIGIGLNLLRGSAPKLPDMPYPAFSIEEETGRKIDPAEMLYELVSKLTALRPLLGTPAFITRWEANLAYLGEPVALICPEKAPIRAIVRGIDPEGRLLIEREDGKKESILAGELSLRALN